MSYRSRVLRASRRLCAILPLLLAFLLTLPSQAQVVVRGVVQDATTRRPLAGAHVALRGTAQGTATDATGHFALRVPALPSVLSIQHVGYETATVTVTADSAASVRVRLAPSVIQLGEVLVSGEDPAIGVMRRVLAHKQQWWPLVRTYAASGFTRLVLEHDQTIVLVSDAQYDVLWDRERGPRDVVRAVSQTADWHHNLPVHPAGHVPNLYADYVEVHGLQMIGPTHPDAFEHYVFRIAGRRTVDEGEVIDLYVSPRDERRATFVGTLTVLDSVFAVVRADLRPARHVTFPPPVAAWRGTYVQQFEHVADTAWLPTSLWSEGTLRLALDARTERSLGLRRQARLADYRLNVPLPEAPYDSTTQVLYAATAQWPDLLFIRGRGVLPFTEREEAALGRLRDEPLTLRQAFPPEERTGPLVAFLRGEPGRLRLTWPTIMGYEFHFRYNRVDGFYSSIGQSIGGRRYDVDWRLAQASGLSRVRAGVHVRQHVGERAFVGGGYFRGVEAWPRGSRFGLPLASLQAGLGGGDYFDFFWAQRFTAEAGVLAGPLRLTASAAWSEDASVERQVTTAWPLREAFRPNPPIDEGRIATLHVTAGLDAARRPPDAVLRCAALTVEHAPGAASDYGFTQISTLADVRLPTLARRRPAPATLAFRFTAGTSYGDVPVQRLAALDGSLTVLDAGIARWGTFRSLREAPRLGRHQAALFWEHDFTTLPFEWLHLWPLVHHRTGLSVYGAHGRTALADGVLPDLGHQDRYRPARVHEIGLGLTHIGDTPLRLDVTVRLDEPGVFVGIGIDLE